MQCMPIGGIRADGLTRDIQKRTVGDSRRHLGLLLAVLEPRERQNYICAPATVLPETSALQVRASAGLRTTAVGTEPSRPPLHVYKSWQSAGTGQDDLQPVTTAAFCRRDACR